MGVAFYTIFVMFLVAVINAGNIAWGIFAGDQLISVAASPSEGQAAIRQLIDENSSPGTRALLEKVYLKQITLAGPALSGDKLKAAISDAMTSKATGTEVVVNGKTLLVMNSRQEAEQLLNELKAPYVTPEGSTRFAEDVKLVDAVIEKSKAVSVAGALEIIKNGTQKSSTYQVKQGDTLWGIASSQGIAVDKLLALNPGLVPGRLQPGDSIKLSRTEYLINIETLLTKVSTETMEYPVEEKKDPSLLLGEKRILSPGRDGKREVTYQIVLRNGAEAERREVSEVVLDNPEPRVVVTGTRALLASRGGGRLVWPTAGGVVSGFGPRGGEMHTGIDIGGYTGNPVVASESGTVIRAGWYGGYGKCVDISHGEGVITRYAHLNTINVDVGQSVSRGEFIGRVGSTGYATGPHLHFEVIVNGQRMNPMNYL